MIRVLFLHPGLQFGGAERVTQAVHEGIDRQRFAPIVCTLYDAGPIGEEMMQSGAVVYHNLCPGRFSIRPYFALRALLRNVNADVVNVTDSTLPLFWAGVLRRRGVAKKLSVAFHSTGPRARHWRDDLAKRTAVPVADRFVALSGIHRDYLAGNEGVSLDRFSTIPNGVDVERFTPVTDKAAAKVAAGFPANSLLVGIVAALRDDKNHEMFIDVAASLRNELPDARFLIIGDGPRRQALEQHAKQHSNGAVQFLGAHNDVTTLVRALDVEVLTSVPIVETFPVVLLEGMASGVPVCSTDVGAVRDMVEDGVHGFISPVGEVGAMAANIRKLLCDEQLRCRMGAEGRRRVASSFTKAVMIRGYEDLFEQLATGGTRERA